MEESLVTQVVRIKDDLVCAKEQARGQGAWRLKRAIERIDLVLSSICVHDIVDDEVEYVVGLEPRLERIRYCRICELPADKCTA